MVMAKNPYNKYFTIEKYNNLAEMALGTIKKHKKKKAIQWFAEDGKTVKSITYGDLGELMQQVFGGLRTLGYAKSDHIALCSETRAEWVYVDLGMQSLGVVNVAIYPSLKPREMLYILNDSEAQAIFVDTQENLEKILAIQDELDHLKHIIIFEDYDDSLKQDNIMLLEDLLIKGKVYFPDDPKEFKHTVNNIDEEHLASLIYTSGTTGVPKGVMLTHKNFLSDAYLAISVTATLRKNEKPWEMDMLSLLPYAHSLGRCVNEYCAVYIGATIDIVSELDPEQIRTALEVFKPSIIVGIPYLFQKIYNIVLETVEEMPPLIQNVYKKTEALGREYASYKIKGEKPPFGLRFKFTILGNAVRKVLMKHFGGNLKLMISGSAAIAPELMVFFNMFKFNLIEGYGLTESAPVTHMLRSEHNSDYHPEQTEPVDEFTQLGKIGPTIDIKDNPYEPVEQKLTPEGELLIRGPMIMKGYWKKPQLTKVALDDEGWLHTGDIAEIDELGYAKIVGRAKVIIKLATGKMISPAAVENLIVPASRKVAQIILVGDDTRKYLTAIVVPYQKPFREYAEEKGINYNSWKDLLYHPEIQKEIKREVDDFCAEVSGYSTPKKFLISSAAFTAKENYITPTYKFKRAKIYEDLKKYIDQLYESDDLFLVIDERVTDFYDQSLIIA